MRVQRLFAIGRRGGVLACALGLVMVIFEGGRLPLVGEFVAKVGSEPRLLVLLLGSFLLLARWEIEGRTARAVARSLLAMWLRPARLVAWRAAPEPGPVALADVTIAHDDRGARLRPAIITGPARLLVQYPFTARRRWRTVRVEPLPGPPRRRGKEILVASGQRVVIR